MSARQGDIERLLDEFSDLRRKANVGACFGEPVTVEDRTVIPVASVTYGFGMAAGREPGTEPGGKVGESEGTESPGAGGGGMRSSPLGVLEVTSQETRFRSIIDRRVVAVVGALVGVWCVFWLGRALVTIFGRGD